MMKYAYVTSTMMALCAAAACAIAEPASAGEMRIHIAPRGDEARMMRSGLEMYSLYRSFRRHRDVNEARIDQRGASNDAAISQSGTGNWTSIYQRGSDHVATVRQDGNYNYYGAYQIGKATSTSVAQKGDGNFGFDFIAGW